MLKKYSIREDGHTGLSIIDYPLASLFLVLSLLLPLMYGREGHRSYYISDLVK